MKCPLVEPAGCKNLYPLLPRPLLWSPSPTSHALLKWLKFPAEECPPPEKEKSHKSLFPISLWSELPDPLSITEGRICLEGCVFTFSAPSLHGDVIYLFEMIILNGCGAKVRPYFPVRIGFESLGKTNVKLCIRLTNIRNNSIFASCSPIHTRFPKNETREKGLQDHPFSYLKRDTFIGKL